MSAHEHLNDDVFIDGLYGLIDVEARLGGCAVCASRWNELLERRAAMAAPMEVPAGVLAAQRRNIYARIEHPILLWKQPVPLWKQPARHWAGPAVTAAAAVCLLALGVFVHHPVSSVTPVRPALTSLSDAQQLPEVYSDVYSMEQSFEPTAAASLRVLFESDGNVTEGTGRDTQQ